MPPFSAASPSRKRVVDHATCNATNAENNRIHMKRCGMKWKEHALVRNGVGLHKKVAGFGMTRKKCGNSMKNENFENCTHKFSINTPNYVKKLLKKLLKKTFFKLT